MNAQSLVTPQVRRLQLGKRRGRIIPLFLLVGLCLPSSVKAGERQQTSVQPVHSFDVSADAALAAMKSKADELKIGGVAVVAYFEGETIQSWSSKMIVVGRYKDEPTAKDRGSNLLGIVYAKAAEMADTHRDSGSQVRPPLTGEFGWNGGVIGKSKTGYFIAAFSGGKSEDDVQVSRAGLAKLQSAE